MSGAVEVPATGGVWIDIAAAILGVPTDEIEDQAYEVPFVALGGTSLHAVTFAAGLQRRAALRVEVGELLGPRPLAEVVAAAAPAPPVDEVRGGDAGEQRPLSSAERAMLSGDVLYPSTANHLLFSAVLTGPRDDERLERALQALTARHEALRTVFAYRGDHAAARVLRQWRPTIVRQQLPPPAPGADVVAVVHEMIAPLSGRLLQPTLRPAAVFIHSVLSPRRSVLSLLVHHALVDGWSVGVLWRELVALYRGEQLPEPPAVGWHAVRREQAESTLALLRSRVAELRGAPTTVEIPSDLTRPPIADRRGSRLRFGLTPPAQGACRSVAGQLGVTRNAVLLAAWSAVIARRAAVDELLVGLACANRTAGTEDGVGLLTRVQPVRCKPGAGGQTVRDYVQQVAAQVRAAVAASAVPLDGLIAELAARDDPARLPLAQVGFAAHDELVPARLSGGGLDVEVHEGHCGGTLFDAMLYVQRWGDEGATLAVEYGTSVLLPAEVAALAGGLDALLVRFADHLDEPLPEVVSAATGSAAIAGPDVDAEHGLWQLFAEVCRRRPEAVAVRDADGRGLTYRQLRLATEQQAAGLLDAGAVAGDHVLVAQPCSAAELVSVLACVRIGAAYIGVDQRAPTAYLRHVVDLARPVAGIGDTGIWAQLGVTQVGAVDPWQPGERAVPAPAAADPGRICYVAFTSGSTGRPKGVRIPHRAVVRLARDPTYLVPGATERFLRFAPLSFDASTLEIFAPLLAGGTIEVYPEPHVVPADFDAFVRERSVTGAWLTAGLFRIVADHAPGSFRPLRQLLTGGDVVPPEQVRAVLDACPGLVVSNGYGPTENATFTTTFDLRDPGEVEDGVPIGLPVPGTSALVVARDGLPLPPGAVGELWVYGDGLATDYLDDEVETARGFGVDAQGRRFYRTGDLVRMDGAGRLRFLGRRDRQVKVRGFRVELDAVAHVLRAHPAVRDAVVVAAPDWAEQRLLAGVVGDGSADLVPALLAHAKRELPTYAVPALWALVDAFPVTANGKVDLQRLGSLAAVATAGTLSGRGVPDPEHPDTGDSRLVPGSTDEIADVIADVWAKVLGHEDFGYEDRFFDAGGDSLQLVQVRDALQEALPGCSFSMIDLMTYPTVLGLAEHLDAG